MTSQARRAYIDWARGIAVLLMIEAHTVDAWTRAADRHSLAYRNAIVLGGFAAPLFLWLAGVAVVLSATRTARRENSRRAAVDAVCRRGLEIFILAFLFRLQAFIVSPGQPPIALFRVDILNVMGPAIVAAALVWGAARSTAALAATNAALAVAFAMLTPIVREARALDRLPTWIQWYLRPAGEYTTFTAFPWAGFVFAGAAVGALLAAVGDRPTERRLHLAMAATAAALTTLGFYTASLPSLYSVSSFWTSSPTYFAIRTGVLMLAFAGLFALERVAARFGGAVPPLERFGRASLFVYWIHVELVYGYTTRPVHGRLPLWGTAIAYAAFVATMYGAVLARDRVVSAWRARGRMRESPQRVTA